MQTIKLQWRRGGGWNFVKGATYFCRVHGDVGDYLRILTGASGGPTTLSYDYAGPFALEEEEPEPEMLRIEGYKSPFLRAVCSVWIAEASVVGDVAWGELPLRVHGSTRRQAIERYNALAKMMGAKDGD